MKSDGKTKYSVVQLLGNMFPALEKELSKNQFFKAWKTKSVFEQLIGPPPFIREEFSAEWITDVTGVIGDSPLSSRLLASLGCYLEKIRELEGYQHIKKKLESLDERFYPTLSEIEFIDLLLYNLQPTSIHLEHTFQTPKGKHPELMVDHKSGPVYFEVTRIMDYKEMSGIIAFDSVISAFQLSLKVLKNLNRRISVNFKTLPNNGTIKGVLLDINNQLVNGIYSFQLKNNSYSVDISEGDGVTITIPPEIIEKKLKDKLDEETKQFDEDTCNFVVLDATPAVLSLDNLSDIVRNYFDYSCNTVVWGVFLVAKKWVIEETFNLTFKIECVHQPNLNGRNKDLAIKIVDDLFPSIQK